MGEPLKRPSPWPVRLAVRAALLMAALPLLIAAVLLLLVTVRTVLGLTTRPPAGLFLFLGCLVYFLAVRLRSDLEAGRTGRRVDGFQRDRVAYAAGGFSVADATLDLHAGALEGLGGPIAIDADELPGLSQLLGELATRAGVTVPARALIVPEPYVLEISESGPLIGATALLSLSVDELRAVLAYRLLLAYDPQITATARLARTAATTGAMADGRGGWLRWLNRPAAAGGRIVEHFGGKYVQRARAWAWQEASAASSAQALATGLTRELAARTLWTSTLASWQQYWAATSQPLRPIASWSAVMQQAAASATLTPAPSRIDALEDFGWSCEQLSGVVGHVPCPAAPSAVAAEAFGADAAGVLVQRLDDILAAAYFQDWINESVGARSSWSRGLLTDPEVEGEPRAVDPRILSLDPLSPYPHLDLVERQRAAVDEATVRRGPDAITLCRGIERNPSCVTIGAAAAGGAFLAGDLEAPGRIDAWLAHEPLAACVLSELTPTLRGAGHHALAGRIDELVEQFVPEFGEEIRLGALLGSGRRIEAPELDDYERALLQDVGRATEFDGWLIAHRAGRGARPVFVIRDSAWGYKHEREEQAVDAYMLLRTALPDLQFIDWSKLGSGARSATKKRGFELKARTTAAAAGREPATGQALAS